MEGKRNITMAKQGETLQTRIRPDCWIEVRNLWFRPGASWYRGLTDLNQKTLEIVYYINRTILQSYSVNSNNLEGSFRRLRSEILCGFSASYCAPRREECVLQSINWVNPTQSSQYSTYRGRMWRIVIDENFSDKGYGKSAGYLVIFICNEVVSIFEELSFNFIWNFHNCLTQLYVC
jgi:hypothetical protein